MTEQEINAGILQEEREHAEHLQNSGRIAARMGIQCGGNAPIPELLPDGSLAQPEPAQVQGQAQPGGAQPQ